MSGDGWYFFICHARLHYSVMSDRTFAFYLFWTNSMTRVTQHRCQAMPCKALQKPLRLTFRSTPWSSNSRAMSTCPYCEARCNGTWHWLSCTFRLAPRWMRKRPTSTLPSPDANANGVFWVPFRTSTGMPVLRMSCTTSMYPFSDAMCRGLELLLSRI